MKREVDGENVDSTNGGEMKVDSATVFAKGLESKMQGDISCPPKADEVEVESVDGCTKEVEVECADGCTKKEAKWKWRAKIIA